MPNRIVRPWLHAVWPLLVVVVALSATSATSARTVPGTGEQDQAAVERWASGVWRAARDGQVALLDEYLDAVPAQNLNGDLAASFSRSVAQLRENRSQAESDRATQRAEALTAMRDEREADNLSKALRKAVEALYRAQKR